MKKIFFAGSVFTMSIFCGLLVRGKASYNVEINKAELAITNKNFTSAETHYLAAFKINETPPAIDLQNAITTAIKNGKLDLSFELCRKLASLGVGRRYFEQRKFAPLNQMKGWQEILYYAERKKEEFKNENSALYEMQKEHFAVTRASFNDISSDSMLLLSKKKREIENRLLDIFRRNGYLSEYKIGVNLKEDTLITDPVFTEIIEWNYIVQLSTHEQAYLIPDTFYSILKTAHDQGLVPYDYIERVVSNQSVDSLRLPRPDVAHCKVYLCASTASPEKIDVGRKLLGLCTYDEYLQKIRYSVDNAKDDFNISPIVKHLTFRNSMQTNDRLLSYCDPFMDIPNCNGSR